MVASPLQSKRVMDCRIECGLLFLMICLPFWSNIVEGDAWVLSKEEEVEIEKQLKMLNKPYVKTFKETNGDIYDCVDMYKQPAFDHPLLKNHTSQIRSSLQARNANSTSTKETVLGFGFNNKCPSGTVLIRRTTKEDLIRSKMYAHYFHPAGHTDDTEAKNYYALVIFHTSKERYYGAQVEMEVNHLKNILPNQITSAQALLIKGERGPKDYINTIQFGWHVAHPLYGNSDTHFFSFTTSDGYRTGCYNNCGLFVQVSKKMTPGMILFSNVTKMTLYVNRVDSTGDWSLMYQGSDDDEEIGFWPKDAFDNMADISMVQMGGIVYSPFDEPSPPMGNGVLPEYAKGARFSFISLRDGNGLFEGPDESKVTTFRSLDEYWVGKNGYHGDNGYMFEFGGPGGYKQW